MPTLLFDCDGTLVDSEIIAMGIAIDILADAVQAIKPNTLIDRPALVQEFAGWHFDKMIPEMAKRYNVILDIDALTTKKTPETLKGLEQVQACGGILDFLTRAQTSHQKTALVTSSEFERVNLCLEVTGVGDYFPEDSKFSAHDTLPAPLYKPNPAIYNFALKALGLQSDEAIAIEDSPSGTDSAVDAGIPAIGYVGASHIPAAKKESAAQNLIAHGARVVISHFDDMEAAIAFVENPQAGISFQHPVYKPGLAAAPAPVQFPLPHPQG